MWMAPLAILSMILGTVVTSMEEEKSVQDINQFYVLFRTNAQMEQTIVVHGTLNIAQNKMPDCLCAKVSYTIV